MLHDRQALSSGRTVQTLEDGDTFCVVHAGGIGVYNPEDGSLRGGFHVSGPFPWCDPRFSQPNYNATEGLMKVQATGEFVLTLDHVLKFIEQDEAPMDVYYIVRTAALNEPQVQALRKYFSASYGTADVPHRLAIDGVLDALDQLALAVKHLKELPDASIQPDGSA